MARRLLLVVLLGLVPAGAALGAKPASWASAEIRLLGQDPTTFRADDTVTRGELADLLTGATGAPQPQVAKPEVPLTMQDLDARLVAALGLTNEAKAFAAAVRTAGLAPPSRFGPEVVARLLALRTNHPAKDDALERLPTEPAPRAEAAYSAAQIVRFKGSELARVQEAAVDLHAPELSDWQRRILDDAPSSSSATPTSGPGRATGRRSRSGGPSPAATTARASSGGSTSSRPMPDPGRSPRRSAGRTTYAMSGEVPQGEADRRSTRSSPPTSSSSAQGPEVEAGGGRPHGHLPRKRLVRALVPATAWRSRRSPAGTGSGSRGPGVRSPKRASRPGPSSKEGKGLQRSKSLLRVMAAAPLESKNPAVCPTWTWGGLECCSGKVRLAVAAALLLCGRRRRLRLASPVGW